LHVIAIMKFSSPINDLALWFCTLMFKEDYARIIIWAELDLQLEVLFKPRPSWNLGQIEASRSSMHSCIKIYIGHQKLQKAKVLQTVKQDRTND